jgi:hypothetical protein
MTSTLLATKVEEEPKTVQQIIHGYSKMYSRRLILLDLPDGGSDDDDSTIRIGTVVQSSNIAYLNAVIEKAAATKNNDEEPTRKNIVIMSQHERKKIYSHPHPLNKYGPVYKEWHDQISKMESIVLRQLGFTLYWIPDSHPHKYILYFCQVLELNEPSVRTKYFFWNVGGKKS